VKNIENKILTMDWKDFEEIEKENEITQKIDINSPEFKLTTENIELIEEKVIKEKYRFNISKMKF
jgi:hypothetical protein